MPRQGGRHRVLVRGAEQAMEAFKFEVAQDLGLAHKIDEDGSYKGLTTEEVGQIGGEMVRRIQAAGEWAVKQRYENGADRLMPAEVLPPAKNVRSVTNNGNPTLHSVGRVDRTPGSGQRFEPGNNDITDRARQGSQQGEEPYTKENPVRH